MLFRAVYWAGGEWRCMMFSQHREDLFDEPLEAKALAFAEAFIRALKRSWPDARLTHVLVDGRGVIRHTARSFTRMNRRL